MVVNDSLEHYANTTKEENLFIDACMRKITGNTAQAIAAFHQVLTINPMNAAANYEVAGLYLKQRQLDWALVYARRADSLQPLNAWYKQQYAQVLTALGQFAQAAQLMKELSDRSPQRTEFLFDYADALYKSRQYQQAITVYDRIENLEGISDTLAQCRINVLKVEGDNAGIEQTYEKLIRAFPENETNYLKLEGFYRSSAQPAKLAVLHERQMKAFPASAGVQLQLANDFQQQGEHARAFVQAVKAFAMPNSPESKIKLLQDWYPLNNNSQEPIAAINEADSLCAILCRTHPNQASVWTIRGDYLRKNGKIKEARDAYRKAIALDCQPWTPRLNLMELNAQVQDDAEMQLKEAYEATELFPQQPSAWYHYGTALIQQKKYKEAIDALATGGSYVFEDPVFEMKLTISLIDAYLGAGNSSEAEKLTRNALQKEPDNALVNERMGDVLYALNQVDEAVRYWKLAQSKGNNSGALNTKITTRKNKP
jgi:tetratricopeptide (TPR) repeat protein